MKIKRPNGIGLVLFACAACADANGARPDPGSSASASPSLSAPASPPPSPTTSVSSVASAVASTAPTASERPPEPAPSSPPTPMAANKTSTLADVGLTITPPFPYTLEDRRTHWNIDDTSNKAPSIWLMRKTFAVDSLKGEVISTCANKAEGALHAEPDGSYTYRCVGNERDDGTWFGRYVPTANEQYQTVQCEGSSKSPEKLKVIETTCRSIRPIKKK